MATRKPIAKSTGKEVKEVKKVEVKEEGVNVKAMDFVPVWQRLDDPEDVNTHFGRSGMWASSYASRLRKMGVNLKKMAKRGGGGGKRLDVDELNALL